MPELAEMSVYPMLHLTIVPKLHASFLDDSEGTALQATP
jgi:hypothetical protein